MSFSSHAIIISFLLFSFASSYETDKGIEEAFGDGKFSFAEDANWDLCMERNKSYELDENILDYGKELNKTLKQLSNDGGGAVVLGPGVYPITVPILIPTNTCLIGAGKDKTTLRVEDKSYPPYPFKGSLISHKVERVTLVGFTVDGNADNQQITHKFHTLGRVGIYQERVSKSYLLNVKSINNVRHGCTYNVFILIFSSSFSYVFNLLSRSRLARF